MGKQYTISELAKAVSVPTTTLRYYERAGLLAPEGRSEGNYRLYSDTSLHRLRFIRAAQAIGFSLEDVKTLLGSHEGRMAPCREVQALIQERLLDIDQQLKDLRSVQRVLKASLEKCRASERQGCCHVVESLKEASARTE